MSKDVQHRVLSNDVISLIHHVELNQNGWWKKAIGQILRGIIWNAGMPLSTQEIQTGLRENGISLPSIESVQRELDALKQQQYVLVLPDGKWKLSEAAAKELGTAHATAVAEQEDCKNNFYASCADHCPELDAGAVWAAFSTELVSSIRRVGANTYHLLTDGNLKQEKDWLPNFLQKYEKSADRLRLVLEEFFSASNTACRQQILRLLSAHFFAEASRLKPETLAAIERGKKRRVISVVLDTNFVFSVLGLHENPANEAAIALIDLAKGASEYLQIKLYVIPATLDEAVKTLSLHKERVERIRTTPQLARAALHSSISGLAARFFQAAKESPGLTAEDFFSPYIDGLKEILEAKNVRVLDAHPSVYNQRQDVVDDVLEQTDWQQANLAEAKHKSYETLLHDVVLWHVIEDRRSKAVQSAFDVEYWAVSIDYRLIAFDRAKREKLGLKVPNILYPTNLVQLVQFWLPRSEALDASLVDSLRLPLFFQKFDIEDERATLRILQSISRYKNLSDLPESAIAPMLANQAIKSRLKEAELDDDEVISLIEGELFSENERYKAALRDKDMVVDAVKTQLVVKTTAHEQAQAEVDAEKGRANGLTERLQRAESERDGATAEAKQLKARLQRTRILGLHLLLPLFLGATVALVWTFTVAPQISVGARARIAFGGSILLLAVSIGLLFAHRETSKEESLSRWWLGRLASWTKRLSGVAVASAMGAVWQGGVWDGLKKWLDIFQ
ncbi:hypothetical protein EHZ19_15940 [Paraburkholderia bannensis]|nr:hypothetical protein [Paraburkholderia bannensis]RQM47143.1 hypothetical protein EHZ19_15940 [Paraburkholderia bannensis]